MRAFTCLYRATLSPTPVDFLHALEQKFASSIIYITGQGFKLNLDIFQNPAFSLFLRSGEFEDITRERMLVSFPGVQKAQEVICAFYDTLRTLPAVQAQEIRNLTNAIAELYSHMESAGYKLAHYFGFVLADRFLPYLIPGYHSDPVNTLCYQRMLSDYLEIDIHKLDG